MHSLRRFEESNDRYYDLEDYFKNNLIFGGPITKNTTLNRLPKLNQGVNFINLLGQ